MERYVKKCKNTKKMLDKYVKFSIISIIVYSIVEMTVSSIIGIEHSTLTTCFYACFGGEILSCALIKIFKLKGVRDENNYPVYNEQQMLSEEPMY